jgi:hypothetical protein
VGVEASNDNVAFSAVAGTEPTWTLPAGDGSKTVWVRVTDTAGRTTTQSDQITLDSSLAPVALDRTTVSVTVERGTLHRESVTITPSQTLFEATLELSASLNGVANLLGPSGPFKAMDEVGLYLALDFDVPQTAPVGLQSGTLVLRSSVGETLATVAIDVTVVDPPAGVVPATLSTPSSDRRVIDSGGDMVVVDTVIVGLDDAIPNPNQRILDIAAAHAGIVRGSIPSARMYQLQVPGTATPAELETIRLSVEAEANVTYASATYSLSLSDLAPNDPWQDAWWEEVAVWDENDVGGRNWSMELIKMPSAWALQTGDASVPVAILDAGIEFAHPDLAPNAVTYNTDLGKRNPMTTHGTQVAGIACAKGNNNRGVTGVAWDCSLRGYELGILQGLDMHDVASGMIKAADDGARIVNMSIGSRFHNSNCVVRQKALDESTDILRDAIQTVINNGDDVLWIVAAGNDPCDAAIMTPANLSGEFENVITVASANDAGELSDFSARGSLVTVAAAGGQRGAPNGDGELLVLSTASAGCGIFGCDEDYISDWGTSMAAPQVSGLAALVLSSHPDLTATEIKECIVTAAVSNGPAIVGQTFHVVHAPSAVACAPGVENLVMTNDQWKTLELSWAGGVTNAEPNDWQISGFDDSGWSDAYIPPDPYYSWVDIADADWLSSTGRDTGHLTSETWITRRQFEITHPVTGDATLSWNVDNWASIWINGNVLVTNAGTWTSLISTPVPAAFLHQGTNTIAVKVLQDGNTNSWSVNPTFVQAKLVFP